MGLRPTLAAFALLVAIPPGPLRGEPLVIVVSSAWEEAKAIELRDLRAVYLGRRTRLFGARVRRIDLPAGSAARAGFSVSVLLRPEAALERYWIEQALAGGPLPPRQVNTPEEVMAAVRGRIGTIGYLPESALQGRHEGVRALPVIVGGVARVASDPGYPVREQD